MKGVGIAMSFSNAYVCIYYNMVIAYAMYYLVLSFTSELPWQKCNPSWASESNVLLIFNHLLVILYS